MHAVCADERNIRICVVGNETYIHVRCTTTSQRSADRIQTWASTQWTAWASLNLIKVFCPGRRTQSYRHQCNLVDHELRKMLGLTLVIRKKRFFIVQTVTERYQGHVLYWNTLKILSKPPQKYIYGVLSSPNYSDSQATKRYWTQKFSILLSLRDPT